MRFHNLNRYESWWYFPTMHHLRVFKIDTGEKVAEWEVYAPHNVEWNRWSFFCVVNTLPDTVPLDFVTEWKKIIHTRLKECFS